MSSNGTTLTSWRDTSGRGNDLTAFGDPTLAAGGMPSGAPAVALDGDGDSLQRLLTQNGLPLGNEARTVFFLVDYIDPQGVTAGMVYGDNERNQAFGLTAAADGKLAVQGYFTANDFKSNTDGVAGGYLVQSAVLSNGQLKHYRDGVNVQTVSHAYATDFERLVIGEELGDLGHAKLNVGAVLVYDRALSDTERQQVESYLQSKYLVDDGLNDTPVAVGETVSVVPGGTATIDLLNNDIDDGALNGSSITIVSGPSAGTITGINPTTGVVTYVSSATDPTTDSFTYTLTDADGAVSELAVVDIGVEQSALSLEGFSDELVLTRSDLGANTFFQPISMAFLPDNRMLLVSKTGEIRIVDPESGASSLFMQINNIDTGQERGLLDITLDPNFDTNGHFYLYYTPDNPEHARISRFTFQENSGGLTSKASLASEVTIWEDTDGYLACCHYGGGLDIGPDNKIWLTTSDKFQASTPGEGASGGSDLPLVGMSTSGKVIRVNTDGSVPDGSDGQPANPWDDPNDGINDYIWGYGLRNPFRARWDAEYGNFFIAEVGGNQQLIAHEDLHIATLDGPGAFYGWPFYEGTESTYVNGGFSVFDPDDYPDPNGGNGTAYPNDFYSPPIWSLAHEGEIIDEADNLSASLTGGEVYRGDMFPEEWDGVYFYGDYTRDYIRYLILDETGTEVLGDHAFKPSAALPGTTNEVVSIAVGADGALYYAMIASGEIRRVTFSEGAVNDAPQILASGLSATSGDLPFTVTFTATVADDENDPLTYSIDFGDGSAPSTGAVAANGQISIQHTYTAIGNYAVSFELSDPTHDVFAAPIAVQAGDANDAPEITAAGATPTIAEANVTEVSFSASVFDADGDPLSYTWFFGDGSTQTGTAASGDTITATHVYDFDGAYSAFLELGDGEFEDVSETLEIQVGEPTEVPITNGLNLLLQSDIKIGLGSGTTVVAWLDGSGQGNNLFAQGDPQLLSNRTPTGQPAIVFDGAEDLLQRVNATDQIFNLPTGNANRTLFFVVKYVDDRGVSSGLVYGDGAKNEAFGLATTSYDDDLMVQGWDNANDFDSNVDGPAQGWAVQSVVLENGTFDHYLDGALIGSAAHTFATDLQKLIIGGEIAGLGESELEVGAALIYDRALSDAERQQVEDFLQNKYITGTPGPNQPAVANNDSFGMTQGGVLTVGAAAGLLSNDSDPEGDSFTVTAITDQPNNGTLTWNADGSFTYTPNAGFSGQDAFIYQVTGGDTATATVTVSPAPSGGGVPVTTGLVAAYEDENVSLGAGNLVTGWLDGSGRGNDLVSQGDPTQVSGATPTGRSAIAFDGTGDLLQRVNATDSLNGLPAGKADRTMFFVANYLDDQGVSSGFVYGDGARNQTFGLATTSYDNDLMVQGWGVANDFDSDVDGPAQGWAVQSVVLRDSTFNHYLDGALIDSGAHTFATDLQKLIIGAEIAGLGESELEVGAALIYDRALTAAERQQVENYLQNKYITGTPGPNQPAVANNDSFTIREDGVLSVSAATGLLSNDSDPEGDGFVVTAITTQPDSGALTWNPNGSFTYTPDAGFFGEDSFVYQVTGGDTATVTVTVSEATGTGGVPLRAGLVAAYEEDGIGLGAGNLVTGWSDASGRGNDLVSDGDPALSGTTPTGRSAITFDGTGDLLERVNATDPLNGLPAGNADRTMFFVANYIDDQGVSSGFVYGDGARNQTFGVTTTSYDNDLMVQGWGVTNDFDSNVDGPAQGWMVQSVVLENGAFDHYLDGALIGSGAHTFATDLQRLIVGGEIAGLGESELEVGAALIYDRALSDAERQQVESYLQTTYVDEGFAFV